MMIRDYADHAASERTFLAWLRAGIAVGAFGFVIEKFNLFVLTLAGATSLDAAAGSHFERLPGPFGFGAAIHTPGILPDLAFGVILALLLIVLSFYLIA
jgi:hypothetical protein